MTNDQQHPHEANTPSCKDQHFVRNAESKAHHDPYDLRCAFRFAREGIAYVFSQERNMKIHALAAVLALTSGFLLRLSTTELAIIILCIVAVFASECFNTALEAVVDLVSPTYADLAKHAKDAAAGAVLICAIGSVIVGCLIYIPAIIRLFT